MSDGSSDGINTEISYVSQAQQQVIELEKAYHLIADSMEKVPDEARKIIKDVAEAINKDAAGNGYSLATGVAESLLSMDAKIETSITDVDRTILHAHVHALKIIFHEDITGEGDAVSQQVLGELRKVSNPEEG